VIIRASFSRPWAMVVGGLSVFLAVWAGGAAGLPGAVVCRQGGRGVWRLGNGLVHVDVDASRTGRGAVLAVVGRGGRKVPFHDEGFAFTLDRDDHVVTSTGFRTSKVEVRSSQSGGRSLVLRLASPEDNLKIDLTFELSPGEFWVRRRMAVGLLGAQDGKPLILRRAEVHRIVLPDPEGGGMGQPVFAGAELFVGLEHPAGRSRIENGRVVLFHYPGRPLGGRPVELKSEVIGVAGGQSLEDAFAAYIRAIRIPPRHFLLYNSWYDIRRREMSTQAFQDCFLTIQKRLLKPFGLKLHAFVIDDGWQKMDSIWETDPRLFPQDFAPLAQFLQEHDSRLGLWMPLTPVRHNLNLDWARRHGYEITDDGMAACISGPRFNAALRRVVQRHIQSFGVAYYKHDFNHFRCAARGHGHLPESEYGFEANVDAYMDVLRMMRKLNPDIFLNITSNMWLSPWWLTVADTVWRGGGDTGSERRVPYIEPRDASVTYVDSVLWQRFVKEHCRFPPSALMTHGIILGRYARPGGAHEPLHRWAEHIMAYLAPGLMMKELYITSSLLSPEQWEVLGRALQWASADQDLLGYSRMTHGCPARGKIYGFLHVNPDKRDRLVWFVRNPGPRTQSVVLDLAARLRRPPTHLRLLYPWREDRLPEPNLRLEAPPWQTFVIEADCREAREVLRIEGVRWGRVNVSGDTWTVRMAVPPGRSGTARIVSPWPIAAVQLEGQSPVRLDGAYRLELPLPASDGDSKPQVTGGDADGRTCRTRIRVPECIESAILGVLCKTRWSGLDIGSFVVDGRESAPRRSRGDGWYLYTISLSAGAHDVAWKLPAAAMPFSPPVLRMEARLFYRSRLPGRTVRIRFSIPRAAPACPPTPFPDVAPAAITVFPEREFRMRSLRVAGPVTQHDLRRARTALLHMMVFDANGESRYRNKPILLNGVDVGVVPPNDRPISRWQERILTIPKKALETLKVRDNEVVFTNPTGDCYKVTDVALAVQLADGTWVESDHSRDILCSVGNWLYTEGKIFQGEKSSPVRLSFPSGATKR